MHCPYCSTLRMESDKACLCCGRSFTKGGLTRSQVANWMAFIFAFSMVLTLVFAIAPGLPSFRGGVAAVIAADLSNWIFVIGAAVVGHVVGWIIAPVICSKPGKRRGLAAYIATKGSTLMRLMPSNGVSLEPEQESARNLQEVGKGSRVRSRAAIVDKSGAES